VRDLSTIIAERLPNKVKVSDAITIEYEACFRILSPFDREPLIVICSTQQGWDHISVSTPTRCPIWEEMELIKRMFFREDEVCMQLHVATKDHISFHPNVLHLWRPQYINIPLPPKELV
jgi:hypothetical protein